MKKIEKLEPHFVGNAMQGEKLCFIGQPDDEAILICVQKINDLVDGYNELSRDLEYYVAGRNLDRDNLDSQIEDLKRVTENLEFLRNEKY